MTEMNTLSTEAFADRAAIEATVAAVIERLPRD